MINLAAPPRSSSRLCRHHIKEETAAYAGSDLIPGSTGLWSFYMYSPSDLRKGLKINLDGDPYIITDFQFSKPGKGQALYRCRLRNMLNGNSMERTFRSSDKFEKADLEERTMQYLYAQGDEYHFMDTKSYEQITITREQLGDAGKYLIDNMEVDVLLFEGRAIGVTVPNFVNLTVTKAEPWAKGDTSGSDSKPVTVETGYTLQVPPFIEEGDRLQIDTRTGEYVTRVKE
jgi:elongation factor P